MAQSFPVSTGRKGFGGIILLSVDGGSTVWGFPYFTLAVGETYNVSRPSVIDGSDSNHIEIPGVRMGSLDFVCPVMPDRAVHSFLTAACGPRTNGYLPPFVCNIIPYGGAGVQKATGIFFTRISIGAVSSMGGQQSAVQMRASAMVFDIDNFYGAPTLTTPTSVGSNGAGAASFSACSFQDGGSTPASYDGIRSFSVTFDNGMTADPAIVSQANRIAAGGVPSSIRGAITLEQDAAPTNPLPAIRGAAGFTITIPTGDETHSMKLALNASRDGSTLNLVPEAMIGRGQLYALFGKTANSLAPTFEFSTSYA
jgi:hypothetical protein